MLSERRGNVLAVRRSHADATGRRKRTAVGGETRWLGDLALASTAAPGDVAAAGRRSRRQMRAVSPVAVALTVANPDRPEGAA